MQPQQNAAASIDGRPSGGSFQFLFAGLPENVEYYVQAGADYFEALQGSRGGSAVGEADAGDVSLSEVDGDAAGVGGAWRAICGRWRGRTRSLRCR